MPVAGGPNITKTGILLEVDAADKLSYPGTGTTWINPVTPGTYNGTLNNISFDSSDSKGALIFTGSNTYVDFGNLGPSLTSSFSFQVAFKPAATASGQPYTILSYASASATSSITFKLDYTSSNQTVVLTTFSTGSGAARAVHAISASVSSGSWNIVHGTFGSSLAALYVNGLGVAYGPTTGSLTGYNASNQLYAGASYGSDTGFYTGSIANISVNNADLDGLSVNKNYNAFASRFGLPVRRPLVTDADAFAFVETVGLNETQAAAINTLVLGLKSNNLWDKMQAIYPFVGGSAFAHKVNLKSPGVYDVLWSGGIIHTNQGSITTSTNALGDTQFIPTTMLSNVSSSAHISFNFSVGTAAPTRGVMGTGAHWFVTAQSGQALQIDTGVGTGTEAYPSAYNSGQLLITTTADKQGLFVSTRTSSTEIAFYRRSPVQTINSLRTGLPFTSNPSWENHSIYLFQLRNVSAIGVTGSFATIGDGLSQTDVDNLYSLITTFNTTLGRT